MISDAPTWKKEPHDQTQKKQSKRYYIIRRGPEKERNQSTDKKNLPKGVFLYSLLFVMESQKPPPTSNDLGKDIQDNQDVRKLLSRPEVTMFNLGI